MNRFRTVAVACAGLMAFSGLASGAHHEPGHAPGGEAPAHRSDQGDSNSNAQFGANAGRGEDRAAERRSEHADEPRQGSSRRSPPGPDDEHGRAHDKGHPDH